MEQKLSTAAIILALIVIVLGAYTRLSDAGLGCPDWPGCYGQITAPQGYSEISKAENLFPNSPVDTKKATIEMVHRYFAGTLGLLIFAISYLGYKKQKKILMPILLSLTVIFQAALGMWTVTLKLLPIVVMSHLLGGMAILSMLTLYKLQLKYNDANPIKATSNNSKRIIFVAKLTLVLTIFQIFLGGWTSANYAAVTCYDFPYCQGSLIPKMDFIKAFNLLGGINSPTPHLYMDNIAKVTVHMLHRLGAIFLSLSILCLAYLHYYREKTSKKSNIIMAEMLTLLSIQIALGISNIIYVLPIHVAVSHNAVAAFLLIIVICYNFHLNREAKC